jgi:hypothetical protein
LTDVRKYIFSFAERFPPSQQQLSSHMVQRKKKLKLNALKYEFLKYLLPAICQVNNHLHGNRFAGLVGNEGRAALAKEMFF